VGKAGIQPPKYGRVSEFDKIILEIEQIEVVKLLKTHHPAASNYADLKILPDVT
jgi:hypothetical protein